LLLHVVDSSNPDYLQHERTVRTLVEELGADKIPQLLVYNKADEQVADFFPTRTEDSVEVSAFDQEDVTELKHVIEEKLVEQLMPYRVMLSPDEGRLLARCKQETLRSVQQWDEAEERYEVSGYVSQHTALGQELRNRMKDEE